LEKYHAKRTEYGTTDAQQFPTGGFFHTQRGRGRHLVCVSDGFASRKDVERAAHVSATEASRRGVPGDLPPLPVTQQQQQKKLNES